MQRRPSTKETIQTLLLLQPNASNEQLQGQLSDIGISLTTYAIAAVKREFKAVLKLLGSHSLLRNKKVTTPDWLKQARREHKEQRLENSRDVHSTDRKRKWKDWSKPLRRWEHPG